RQIDLWQRLTGSPAWRRKLQTGSRPSQKFLSSIRPSFELCGRCRTTTCARSPLKMAGAWFGDSVTDRLNFTTTPARDRTRLGRNVKGRPGDRAVAQAGLRSDRLHRLGSTA